MNKKEFLFPFTSLKFISLLMLLIVLNISCSLTTNKDGSGNITIVTPSYAPLDKSIGGISDPTLAQKLSNELQSQVRYEIGIEQNGRRLTSIQLKNNDKTSINVPSGVQLTIGVGVYLAKNKDTNYELWNSYLVSDVKTNVMLMANETKFLDFTLDFRKPTRVTTYYPISSIPSTTESPGISDITGGVISPSPGNFPIFSCYNYQNDDTKIISYESSTFIKHPVTGPIGGSNRIYFINYPNVEKYWFVDDYGIYRNIAAFPASYTFSSWLSYDKPEYKNYLSDVFSVHSIGYNNFYYYFLNYGQGMLSTKYNDTSGDWKAVSNIDFSNMSYIYPKEPFLFDIVQDTSPDSNKYSFFISKIGTFYVDDITLGYFADGKRKDGINRLKKLIQIPDPNDARKSILITSVRVYGNTIFLGTREGLYQIKKNSEWYKFRDASYTYYNVLSLDNITKVADFNKEPVISIELDGSIGNKILVVATPRRVWFKKMSTSATDTITVWDGIPFIPKLPLRNTSLINLIDYNEHDVSHIRFVLWDNNNSRFWIGTNHGLCSIDLNKLF